MAAFRGVFPGTREQLLAQELVTLKDSGALIAGIGKLAQSLLIGLLTIAGTKQYNGDDGCQFMLDAQKGFWRTMADVQQSFALSRIDVRRQQQAKETTSDPPDELYNTWSLDNVILSGDKVTLYMTVTSQAGSSFTFLTPITVPLK
jgi:hypothetical protein